jgi:hypothetical protein
MAMIQKGLRRSGREQKLWGMMARRRSFRLPLETMKAAARRISGGALALAALLATALPAPGQETSSAGSPDPMLEAWRRWRSSEALFVISHELDPTRHPVFSQA